MDTDNEIFMRAELLLGSDVMQQIASKRVIVFGVGGVGRGVCAHSREVCQVYD